MFRCCFVSLGRGRGWGCGSAELQLRNLLFSMLIFPTDRSFVFRDLLSFAKYREANGIQNLGATLIAGSLSAVGLFPGEASYTVYAHTVTRYLPQQVRCGFANLRSEDGRKLETPVRCSQKRPKPLMALSPTPQTVHREGPAYQHRKQPTLSCLHSPFCRVVQEQHELVRPPRPTPAGPGEGP